MQHGIEIWLRPLDSFKIADDGKTVTVGGGSLSGNVVAKLWAAKKQTGKPSNPRISAQGINSF